MRAVSISNCSFKDYDHGDAGQRRDSIRYPKLQDIVEGVNYAIKEVDSVLDFTRDEVKEAFCKYEHDIASNSGLTP